MTDLQALLERVEKATGPDRELDADLALRFEEKHRLPGGGWISKGGHSGVFMSPRYTATIDAALALVEKALPGWTWSIDNLGKLYECCLSSNDGRFLIKGDTLRYGRGPTPPLAIIAAMIAAKLSLSSDQKP